MATMETPVSPTQTNRPEVFVHAAAINSEPIELDATPTVAEKPQATALDRQSSSSQTNVPMNEAEREQLAKLINERKADPAVLVDLPQTPQPEELGVVERTL